MDVVEMITVLHSKGIETLKALHGMRKKDLLTLGFPGNQAENIIRTARLFHDPTKHSAKQRRARNNAIAGKLSVQALNGIRKAANSYADGSPYDILERLCQLRGTTEEIIDQADEIVRNLNNISPKGKDKAHENRSMTVGRKTAPDGTLSATIRLEEHLLREVLTPIQQRAEQLCNEHPELTHAQAMADAFTEISRGTATSMPTSPATIPLIVMSLPDAVNITEHKADDTIFGLTDGTTMTGAEVCTILAQEYHLTMLYSPEEGPVNLYRSDRFFNLKQRRMAQAESMVCDVPGCGKPATQCQPHHITAWAEGGNTNAANTAMLCRRCNGLNDDNPKHQRRTGV